MTYQLPEPAIHAPFYKEYKTVYQGDYFTADQMQQAYAAGREAMRQECADHVFSMAQWDENNEQWVVLHRASTAIRNLK